MPARRRAPKGWRTTSTIFDICASKMGSYFCASPYPSLMWSSDSRSVFGPNRSSAGYSPVKIDAQTGNEEILGIGPAEPHPIGFARDGKTMFLVRSQAGKNRIVIARDVATGKETELYRPESSEAARDSWMTINGPVSPDGEWLGFGRNLLLDKSTNQIRSQLIIVPTTPGPARVIFSGEGRSVDMPIVWSPDSRSLYFSVGKDPLKGIERYEVSIDGGPARKLEQTTQTYLMSLSVNPDGKQIAFVSQGNSPDKLVIIENLPPLKGSGK